MEAHLGNLGTKTNGWVDAIEKGTTRGIRSVRGSARLRSTMAKDVGCETVQERTLAVGTRVWVRVQAKSVGDPWRSGNVEHNLVAPGQMRVVLDDTNERMQVETSDVLPQNDEDVGTDDLIQLDYIHEPGVLHNLRSRYQLDFIYTYCGPILVAVNPMRRVPLYGAPAMAMYAGALQGQVKPHVYAVAEQAFRNMMEDGQPQSILIAGESGAGKTESAKYVMQYLAQKGTKKRSGKPTRGEMTYKTVEAQVLRSNPLLEAFGNAKTVRNDNSSRFGKYVELAFDQVGNIRGAKIRTYLLERTRVVDLAKSERSYHIFYQLCAEASPAQREKYKLHGGARSFRYLSQSQTYHLSASSDAEQFLETMEAMEAMGIPEHRKDSLLRTVAAVLHLGNITFVDSNDGLMEGAHLLDADAELHLGYAAELLGCSSHALFAALTQRVIEAHKEKIVKPLDAVAAIESRDSLAKTIYARLFDWLVGAINERLGSDDASGESHETKQRTISILDIYGFESFDQNSFEQLCINLANEKLQQQFNQQVFKREQEDYQNEGIDWSYIDFRDNQDVLDVIEAEPYGILSQIDEACRLPKTTHKDLCVSLYKHLKTHQRFEASDRRPDRFAINHYAGQVVYDSEHLLEKNKDYVVAEHTNLISQSNFDFLKDIFLLQEAQASTKSSFRLTSVGFQFKQQLNELMKALRKTQPHYIRCIKPNPQGEPGEFDSSYSLEQLRCGGVMEAVRIANQGFPARKHYLQFAARYGMLIPTSKFGPKTGWDERAAKSITRNVLQATGVDGWQLGHTRVFLKAGCLAVLESAVNERWTEAALLIQACWRCYKTKQWYLEVRRSTIRLQAGARALAARKKLQQLRTEKAVLSIQTYWRMLLDRRTFIHYKQDQSAIRIQSFVRMWLARQRYLKETEAGKRALERLRREEAAIVLQKYVRKRLAIVRAHKRKAKVQYVSRLQEENRLLRASVTELKISLEEKEAELTAIRSLSGSMPLSASTKASEPSALPPEELTPSPVLAEPTTLSAQQLEQEVETKEQLILELQTALTDQTREHEQLEKDHHLYQAELSTVRTQLAQREVEKESLLSRVKTLEEKISTEEEVKQRMVSLQEENAANEAKVLKLLVELDRVGTALEESKVAGQQERTRIQELQTQLEHESQNVDHWRATATDYEVKLADALCRLDILQNQMLEAKTPSSASTKKSTSKPKSAANFVHRSEVDRFVSAAFSRNAEIVYLEHGRSKNTPKLSTGGSSKAPAKVLLGVPYSAWLIADCLYTWSCRTAKPALPATGGFYDGTDEWLSVNGALNVVTSRVRRVASSGMLETQAYWLSVSISLEAFLAHKFTSSAESHTRRHLSSCRQLIRSLIARLAHLILSSVKSGLEPHLVACSQAKLDVENYGKAAVLNALPPSYKNEGALLDGEEDLLASPWENVVANLSTTLGIFQGKMVPPATIRFFFLRIFRFIDAELLNTLLMRRECCSTRNARSISAGIMMIEDWAKHKGEGWCGTDREISASLCHIEEAAHFLQVHKEDLSRAHRQGVHPAEFLGRVCPALTLTQVVQLTAHHHDDWLAPRSTSHATVALLADLRKAITAQQSCGKAECLLFDVEERLFGNVSDKEDEFPEPIQSSSNAILDKYGDIESECASKTVPQNFADVLV